jgi:hypothetical protein
MTTLSEIVAAQETVDQSAIKGEKGTGYEARGKLGPFRCSNCKYYSDTICNQSTMVKISKMPKTSGEGVIVDPKGCCIYIERVGR